MCISKKHVEYLQKSNEDEYRLEKISHDTYYRLRDIVERCETCEFCGNGEHGDTRIECRFILMRAMASMKWDAEQRIQERWFKDADEEIISDALRPHLAPLPPPEPVGSGGQE